MQCKINARLVEWKVTSDMVEAAVMSLVDEGRFPSVSLSMAGGIDYWREVMRKALIAAIEPDPKAIS